MKQYESKYVQCPFYHSESKRKIHCEGVECGSSTHLVFESPDGNKKYKKKYCCGDFKKCLIAKMLYRKYELENGS